MLTIGREVYSAIEQILPAEYGELVLDSCAQEFETPEGLNTGCAMLSDILQGVLSPGEAAVACDILQARVAQLLGDRSVEAVAERVFDTDGVRAPIAPVEDRLLGGDVDQEVLLASYGLGREEDIPEEVLQASIMDQFRPEEEIPEEIIKESIALAELARVPSREEVIKSICANPRVRVLLDTFGYQASTVREIEGQEEVERIDRELLSLVEKILARFPEALREELGGSHLESEERFLRFLETANNRNLALLATAFGVCLDESSLESIESAANEVKKELEKKGRTEIVRETSKEGMSALPPELFEHGEKIEKLVIEDKLFRIPEEMRDLDALKELKLRAGWERFLDPVSRGVLRGLRGKVAIS